MADIACDVRSEGRLVYAIRYAVSAGTRSFTKGIGMYAARYAVLLLRL